jgi:putative hemolysin
VGMLWNGIYEYLEHYKLEYLSGSVSISADEPESLTSKMYAFAKYKKSVASPEFSVTPLPHCIDTSFDPDYIIEDIHLLKKELPKVFLGYMVLDTKVCGPSGYDSILNTKDFYILSCMKDRENHRRIQRFKSREQ